MSHTFFLLSLTVLAFTVSFAAKATTQNCADRLVVTRFAPSPTGRLHIGGARTALFNYLYAKRMGGKFLLRIEDTDRERSRTEHVDAILSSLDWLGLKWDDQPVIQSSRVERHLDVARELLASGRAYYCYLSQNDLERMRRLNQRIESPWRDRDPRLAPSDVQPVIRLKTPRDGITLVNDRVMGQIAFQNKTLDDMILVRSDGSPTYNFAVVVDDHDMGVTDIIRGVDHLTNAARQQVLYEALGWSVPRFAHVPLIHSAEGKKLSKRDGAAGTDDYRDLGVLPEAMTNYLARLGWAHGTDEIFSLAQAARWFDIDDVRASASRLDLERIFSLNREYIRQREDEELVEMIVSLHPEASSHRQKLMSLMPELKVRARTLVELGERSVFVFSSPQIQYEVDRDAREALSAIVDWKAEVLLARLREIPGATNQVRMAVSGSAVGVPLGRMLEVLGREEVLKRIGAN